MIPGIQAPLGGLSSGSGAAAYSFIAQTDNVNDQTTYTFSGQSFGAAAADRVIVVAVMGSDDQQVDTLSSVSIGGNPATAAVPVVTNSSGSSMAWLAIYYLLVPTGTSGTISVVWSGTIQHCKIAVYRLTGVNPVPVDQTSATGSDPGGSVSLPSGGVVIAAAFSRASTSATWTGAGGLVEDYDDVFDSATATGASKLFTSGQTVAATADFGSNTHPVFGMAAWGP